MLDSLQLRVDERSELRRRKKVGEGTVVWGGAEDERVRLLLEDEPPWAREDMNEHQVDV